MFRDSLVWYAYCLVPNCWPSAANTPTSSSNSPAGSPPNDCVHLRGCKEREVSKNWNAGPVKGNAWLSRDPAVFAQPCRLTMASIQIGAKGEVQPFETG